MDQMDIESVLVVPDTPTRSDNSSGANKDIQVGPTLSGRGSSYTEQTRNQPNNASRFRRLFRHPRRHGSGDSVTHYSSSSSSRNDTLLASEDISTHKDSLHLTKQSEFGFGKRKVCMENSSETSKVDKEDQCEFGLNMINGGTKGASCSNGTLARATRQRRLVRNGCISPHNIAKAKKPVERDHNDPLTLERSYGSCLLSSSNNSKSQINAKDLESEGHVSNTVNEMTGASQDAFRNFEEFGGGRNPRNRHQELQSSLSDEDHHLCHETKYNQSKLLTRENGIDGRSHDQYPSARTLRRSTSSNNAECSTSSSTDTDIAFIDSFMDHSNSSRENADQNCSRRDNLEPIIEIDDLSPQATSGGSRRVACSRSDEEARARQLEADERLALELQEQLFNESPVFGVNEIDGHVARALHQEDFHLDFSGQSHHAYSPVTRSRLAANIQRQYQLQSSRNVSQRARRTSGYNRLARWSSRFPGQPRTLLSSSGRNSMFPPHVDVETRMEVLETLEAFSNIGVDADFLQTQRDFDENDYERLLALDENNHQHAGASIHQINGLPESIVQNENLEEACTICLENPTMGDNIRHLPCLHKFHKDCIDPWLQRRSCCPVCKSSIT